MAQFIDSDGTVRLNGTLTGGLPVQWTEDGSGGVIATVSDVNSVPVTVQAIAGQAAVNTRLLVVKDEFGIPLFYVQSDGVTSIRNANDQSGLTIDTSGTSVAPAGSLGFYSQSPIAQQTGVAVNAAAIHAALVNLGLITA